MTVPSNPLSPYRRGRWPAARNVGAAAILPYAPMEVIESDRPDTGGGVTPTGGRTEYEVVLAGSNSPNKIVCNGPIRLLPGDVGPCNDQTTAFVRYSTGLTPAVGQEVGVTAGQQFMDASQTGWVVLGDIDATHSTMRVMRLGGGGGSQRWIGTLDADLAASSILVGPVTTGSFTVWEQLGTTGPTPTAQTLTVINVTDTVLRGNVVPTSAPLMYAEEIEGFNFLTCFPAQIEECFIPGNTNTNAIV